jgi:hypothetical protein
VGCCGGIGRHAFDLDRSLNVSHCRSAVAIMGREIVRKNNKGLLVVGEGVELNLCRSD